MTSNHSNAGPENGGKDEILKSLFICSCGGFTTEELNAYIPIVAKCCLDAVQALIKEMRKYNVEFFNTGNNVISLSIIIMFVTNI